MTYFFKVQETPKKLPSRYSPLAHYGALRIFPEVRCVSVCENLSCYIKVGGHSLLTYYTCGTTYFIHF